MTKTATLSSYLLAVASYFSIFGIFMIAFSVVAPAQAGTYSDDAKIKTAAYATYTPQMAERGQRFYVGH